MLIVLITQNSGKSGTFGVRNAAAPSVFELEAKKSIEDLTEDELKGKKVLVRCDVNVPLDGKTITDDTRIRAALPTLRAILEKGGRPVVLVHFGRPKGQVVESMRVGVIGERLAALLGAPVTTLRESVGPDVERAAPETEAWSR